MKNIFLIKVLIPIRFYFTNKSPIINKRFVELMLFTKVILINLSGKTQSKYL